MAAWAEDGGDRYGGNQLLNKALDVSVGVAQIKPRTALTASLLATGRTVEDLPRPEVFAYRNSEAVTSDWMRPETRRKTWVPPVPVPAERRTIVAALLDDRVNIATCAQILALYQNQWQVTDPALSLRGRPEILATLYQIGFARSKPHGAPRSSAFGRRVREVFDQPWLAELLGDARSGQVAA